MKEKAREFMPIVNAPVVTASAEVLQTFPSSDKVSVIAGCKVTTGTLTREALYRVVRDSNVWQMLMIITA